MSDVNASIRNLPLIEVLAFLGFKEWKTRTGKYGKEHYGSCPIHQPKNNSTSFSFASNGVWHCFSCEKKGHGAIDLVMEVRAIGFKEAIALLETSCTLPQSSRQEHQGQTSAENRETEATLKPYKGSYEKFKVDCPWLEQRIPNKEVLDRYGVFCYDNPARKSAYSGRVMLPVKDIDGVLYGYLGRLIHEQQSDTDKAGDGQEATHSPKYLFPKGLPKHLFLFGAYELKAQALGQGQTDTPAPAPLKYVYLVESPFCVMKFASLGLPAVSPFGWSVSEEQLVTLARLSRGIVYLPDKNKRQESGAQIQKLASLLWVRCPELPVEDPEHLSLEQIQSL